MRNARWSPPFATQRGAAIVSGSYFNATAKWVGFVMTTSAEGTAAIMRRRDRSSRIWRSRCLIIGSPSLCLNSSFISCREIEEHTSELQSLMRISYAVFCLNKKTNHHNENYYLSTTKTLNYRTE